MRLFVSSLTILAFQSLIAWGESQDAKNCYIHNQITYSVHALFLPFSRTRAFLGIQDAVSIWRVVKLIPCFQVPSVVVRRYQMLENQNPGLEGVENNLDLESRREIGKI